MACVTTVSAAVGVVEVRGGGNLAQGFEMGLAHSRGPPVA